MKAFTLSSDQISSVAAALVVDELGVRFGRHIDTLTGSGWTSQTLLHEGGAELSPEEAVACGARIFRFFSIDGAPDPGAKLIGDWVKEVEGAILRSLTAFNFNAAGDDANEHEHPADEVFAAAAAAANLLYGRRRILYQVAPHSFIGFILSTLTPNLLDAPSVDVRTMPPDELKSFLAFGDALVATPSLLRYVVTQQMTAPDNTMAISFGEPMTPDLSAAIRKAGFGAQREIYGSTENGLIGWRDSPSDPFALFDHWRREGDILLRTSPSGETRPIEPMDLLIFEGDRRFRLGGRKDGAVQIGGINVFPLRIAAKISEHADIDECKVTVSRHAGGADRLVATIKLKKIGPPSEPLARAIDNWCRQRLRPHERPRIYDFVTSIEP